MSQAVSMDTDVLVDKEARVEDQIRIVLLSWLDRLRLRRERGLPAGRSRRASQAGLARTLSDDVG